MALTGREFKAARVNAGLPQRVVAAACGMSRPQYGRVERGASPQVSINTISRIASVLGLDASLRFYPAADPLRDAAHLTLLERFRARLHPSLSWRTEVPLPRHGDQRAWDGVVQGFRLPPERERARGGVEAETRPVDAQALERKLALKERDGGVDWVILLLLDSRHNRAFLARQGGLLKVRFPLDGRQALELLGAGINPGMSAIVLL